tara:strand:- start:690 stop:1148 length:459 start_codon:yes stop_codon:yes gene_type:complete
MKLKKYILITLLIFSSSCGYKSINNLESFNFVINEYEFTGDKKINYILERNFKRFQSDENNPSNFKILVSSEKNISAVSKNTDGKVSTYNIEVIVELEVFKNQKLVDSNTFKENINYDDLNSKFELKQYENILLKDLVDQIILKINNYINFL